MRLKVVSRAVMAWLLPVLGLGIVSCAGLPKKSVYLKTEHTEYLPEPDVVVRIPGMVDCTDSKGTEVRLKSGEPVTVLVHGCSSSAGRYRALAGVFAFHGQQTLCFTYNDRDSLKKSSGRLTEALNALHAKIPDSKLQVIGHSQGGLISRRALADNSAAKVDASLSDIKLTTVSSPFSGIEAASHCGSLALGVFSLGATKLICQMVTGSKAGEIPPGSEFMTHPGGLVQNVSKYLMVVTDERGSCRTRDEEGRCREDDFVFSLKEQRNAAIEKDPRISVEEISAGHVEIVGTDTAVPYKLINTLQEYGVLNPTPPGRKTAFQRLLYRLFAENRNQGDRPL
jgi:hypothetical protein